MSTKHQNPYNRGNYAKVFGMIMAKQIVTRSQVFKFLSDEGLKDTAADATATVVLSPRESSKRGDCRGNASSMGHLYFMRPLKHVKGEEKRFRLFWRKTALERRISPRSLKLKKEVHQERTVKAKKGTKVAKVAKTTAPANA